MSLVNLKEKWSGATSGADSTGDGNITLKSGRVWTALSDDPANDTPEIIRAQALIKLGDALAGSPYRFIRSVSCKRISPIMYEISASYVGETTEEEENESSSPLDAPPQISRSFAASEEAIDVDVNGAAIQTFNKESFDPPLTETIYDRVYTISRNMSTYDDMLAWEYMGSVNSDTFLGFPAGTCRVTDFSSTDVYEADFVYFKVTVALQVRYPVGDTTNAQTWRRRVLHQGFLVVPDAGGTAVHAKDGEKNPVVTPVLISKTTGKKVTEAEWKYFETKREVAFSAMQII